MVKTFGATMAMAGGGAAATAAAGGMSDDENSPLHSTVAALPDECKEDTDAI